MKKATKMKKSSWPHKRQKLLKLLTNYTMSFNRPSRRIAGPLFLWHSPTLDFHWNGIIKKISTKSVEIML